MATSGSTDYTQTRSEIILDAFQLLGIYGVGRTVSAEDEAFAVSMLNKMIKTFQAQGLHLWSKEEATVFFTKSQASYALGTGSTDYAALDSDVVMSELSSNHIASDTTIEMDSTTGMAASDTIGIVLDDDTIHWTTIVSVDSATQVTITSGLASAAAADNNVYTYTTALGKPLRIHSVRRATGVGNNETQIPMLELSRDDYFSLPTKAQNGLPTHYYYNPDLNNGTLYVWPRPNDPELYMRMTFERELEDMDAASNNFDFPDEWLETLTYQLAVRLAPAFGRDQKLAVIGPIADDLLENIKSWDAETTSIQLIPDRGGY